MSEEEEEVLKRLKEEGIRQRKTAQESINSIVKDLAGYLFGQILVSRNGMIDVRFTIEEFEITKLGYMAQGGITYKNLPKEESKDVEPDNPV